MEWVANGSQKEKVKERLVMALIATSAQCLYIVSQEAGCTPSHHGHPDLARAI